MATRNARALGELVQVLSGLGPGSRRRPSPSLVCSPPHPLSVVGLAEQLGATMACPPSAFVVAAAVCNRLFALRPAVFSPLSAHKLLVASAVVGCKVVCDGVYSNQFYGEVCAGLTLGELNAAEAKLLALLAFDVFVSPAQYEVTDAWLHDMFPEPQPGLGSVCESVDLAASVLDFHDPPSCDHHGSKRARWGSDFGDFDEAWGDAAAPPPKRFRLSSPALVPLALVPPPPLAAAAAPPLRVEG